MYQSSFHCVQSVYGTKDLSSCNTADSTPVIKKEPDSIPPSQSQVGKLCVHEIK